MPLNPVGGLRRLRYDAKSPGKLQVAVPPGTVIETTDEFAAVLQSEDGHFRDEPAAVETPAVADDDEPQRPRKPRK